MGHFLLFCPLPYKKIAGDIIILHEYQKPQAYEVRFLIYGVRQTEFNNLTNQKIKILKKRKRHLEILSFYTCEP